MVDELGNVVTEERPVRKPDGSISYSSAGPDASWEGNYVAYTTEEYVKDDEGTFYRQVLPRNNDSSNPKPWYRIESQQVASQDGLYIWTQTIGNQYNYTEVSTWLTWGHTEEELAEKEPVVGHSILKINMSKIIIMETIISVVIIQPIVKVLQIS